MTERSRRHRAGLSRRGLPPPSRGFFNETSGNRPLNLILSILSIHVESFLLWPQFLNLSEDLNFLLQQITNEVIRTVLKGDVSDIPFAKAGPPKA